MRTVAWHLAAVAAIAFGVLAPAGARAQSRLTLFGGGLIPFSDLEAAADPSLQVGMRIEYQPVNARGKRRLNSWFLQGSWTPLAVKSELKGALERAGESTDSDLVAVEAGGRIYSRAAPLFLQAGAGWARYNPPGVASSEDLVGFHLGAGFLIPIPLLYLEADAAFHQAFGSDDLSLTYVTADAGVSLPF